MENRFVKPEKPQPKLLLKCHAYHPPSLKHCSDNEHRLDDGTDPYICRNENSGEENLMAIAIKKPTAR